MQVRLRCSGVAIFYHKVILRLITLGEAASLGRYISSSCPPPSWLTDTPDARPAPRRSSLMSEHSLCTDNTGMPSILSSVLQSDLVMSSPGIAIPIPSSPFKVEGTHIPSSCFVDADEIIPTSTLISRCSGPAPGNAVQSKASSTSPGTCIIGSRTSSQKKLLASAPGPLDSRSIISTTPFFGTCQPNTQLFRGLLTSKTSSSPPAPSTHTPDNTPPADYPRPTAPKTGPVASRPPPWGSRRGWRGTARGSRAA